MMGISFQTTLGDGHWQSLWRVRRENRLINLIQSGEQSFILCQDFGLLDPMRVTYLIDKTTVQNLQRHSLVTKLRLPQSVLGNSLTLRLLNESDWPTQILLHCVFFEICVISAYGKEQWLTHVYWDLRNTTFRKSGNKGVYIVKGSSYFGKCWVKSMPTHHSMQSITINLNIVDQTGAPREFMIFLLSDK